MHATVELTERFITNNSQGASVKQILVIHSGAREEIAAITVLGQPLTLQRIGHRGDPDRARALIAQYAGLADAIGIEGISTSDLGKGLPAPIVDGNGVRAMLERWAINLIEQAHPELLAQHRVLMVPAAGNAGIAQALKRRVARVLRVDRLLEPGIPALAQPAFAWADVIAGDLPTILRMAPARMRRKIVLAHTIGQADLNALRQRGVMAAVGLFDPILPDDLPATPATLEAILAALSPAGAPLNDDTYLDLLAELEWTPRVSYLQTGEEDINRFAFAIHPLDVSFIHSHPLFGWTRYLPDPLVEAVAAYFPPLYVGRVVGGVSPTTGQRIEGHLLSLGSTPRQMMRHSADFTYRQLNRAAKQSERLGARIMGLGAFTSVVGDAGITVAHEADIAITSGNSLTVAATLEAAKEAVRKMGAHDLTHGRAMVIGATGSIGSVCARLLAQAIYDVVLVSIEPEKLIALKRTIEAETPGAQVHIATHAADLVESCDLIVTATSAFGQRIVDISRCKPGAVICDVARPPDISAAEAALRPDVLVVESGEVRIPGEVKVSYNIGLPQGTVYACLAETALLAMEGRFEDYTLGRNISLARVKEIYRLFKKHGFQLAGLRSFGEYITDEDLARRRELAARLLLDPELLERTRAEVSARIAQLPASSKGVQARSSRQHTKPAAPVSPRHEEVSR
jgi:predicted amino acid dehydrogenase